MSEMEKKTEGTDIGTSISSSEINVGSCQKDEASGKADKDNDPSILSDNKEEKKKKEEEEKEEKKKKKKKKKKKEEEMEEEKKEKRREEIRREEYLPQVDVSYLRNT